jgi:hypothetical protein
MRVNQRGWTPIESDDRWGQDGYYDHVAPKCDALAKWWSGLHHEDEQEAFARQRAYEDGNYDNFYDEPNARYYDGGALDPEYIRDKTAFDIMIIEHERNTAAKVELRLAQMDFCEERLQQLGARMKRPYEHWNEDEALMAYMERER